MDPPGASLRLPPAPSPPMVGAKDPRRSEFSWHRGWPRWPGEDNHVHLLIQYPPKVSVPSLVNSLKGGSSRNAQTGTAWFEEAVSEARSVVALLLRSFLGSRSHPRPQ